jgi:alkanesulfonate monooxygenase SsuD/methylene tetrahydromethanopterin reductase-like flavin-dependent oxidoreductase (luciferase family)
MKFHFFHLMPYQDIDPDFLEHNKSSWITLPNTYYDPKKGSKLYHRYLDELELADELGFDGVCVNEHHQTAYGMMPSPNVLAGALSRRLKKATIGVIGRALPIVDNPLVIAEEFAMIDNLMEGRFIAGFVRGIGCEYHASMTNPGFSHERFREAHDLIIRAWSEPGPFEFYGKHYHFQYVNLWPRPYQTPHPPIWIPSQGSTETVEFAAHPDRKYTYIITFSPIASVKKNLKAYRDQCEVYGYECPPEQLGWAMPAYVAETDEIARKEAAPHIESLFNRFITSPAQYKLPPGYSSLGSYKAVMAGKYAVRENYLTCDELIENGMFLCGSAATVAEKLEEYQAEMGFGQIAPMLQFGTLPADLTEKNLRIFAGEVIPKVRHLGVTKESVAAE